MELKFKPNDTGSCKSEKSHQFVGRTERKSSENERKEAEEEEIVPMKKIDGEDEEFRTWEQLREINLSRKGKWEDKWEDFLKSQIFTSP